MLLTLHVADPYSKLTIQQAHLIPRHSQTIHSRLGEFGTKIVASQMDTDSTV